MDKLLERYDHISGPMCLFSYTFEGRKFYFFGELHSLNETECKEEENSIDIVDLFKEVHGDLYLEANYFDSNPKSDKFLFRIQRNIPNAYKIDFRKKHSLLDFIIMRDIKNVEMKNTLTRKLLVSGDFVKLLKIVIYSDNFVEEYYEIAKTYNIPGYTIQKVKDIAIGNVSIVRDEYLRLRETDEEMSDMIIDYFEWAINQYDLLDLYDLWKAYYMKNDEKKLFKFQLTMLRYTALIVDLYALCKMFNNTKNSEVYTYGGYFHALNYMTFFEMYLNCEPEIYIDNKSNKKCIKLR